VNRFIIFILLVFLSACTGLSTNSTRLNVGSTKEDVRKAMGNPLRQSSQEDVVAWQYGAKAGLGYCEYKVFFFLNGKVMDTDWYYHESIAGCTAGLQNVDWGPVLEKARAMEKEQAQAS